MVRHRRILRVACWLLVALGVVFCVTGVALSVLFGGSFVGFFWVLALVVWGAAVVIAVVALGWLDVERGDLREEKGPASCATCGYPVQGLSRCPECGRPTGP